MRLVHVIDTPARLLCVGGHAAAWTCAAAQRLAQACAGPHRSDIREAFLASSDAHPVDLVRVPQPARAGRPREGR